MWARGSEARLDSDEVEFGRDWHDHEGVQCEASWIHDTGELYLTRAPRFQPFMVQILDMVPTREEVDQLLRGWESAKTQADSMRWVHDRVAQWDVRDQGVADEVPPTTGAPPATS